MFCIFVNKVLTTLKTEHMGFGERLIEVRKKEAFRKKN